MLLPSINITDITDLDTSYVLYLDLDNKIQNK